MSRRTAYALAITGCAAVIGSCVPLGQAVMHVTHPAAAQVLELAPERGLAGHELTLAGGQTARATLELALQSNSVQVQHGGGQAHYHLRYRLPVTLGLGDGAGQIVSEDSRIIDWTEPGTHARHAQTVTAAGGNMTLSYDFPKFTAPANGKLVVDAALGADRDYGATVTHARLRIGAATGGDAVAVTAGVFMLLGGWVAAVCGVALLITERGNAPPAVSLAAPTRAITPDVRRLAMFCHLAGFAGYLVPFGNVLAVAVLWLLRRETDPFIDAHGREALNFQLSMLVYVLIAFSLLLAVIGLLMLPLLLLFQVVSMIEGAVQAQSGQPYRYPLTFRFLRTPAPPAATA